MKRYPKLGLEIPQILLPTENIDFYKWAVIACDQFTSQPQYWQEVENTVGSTPSTFHMIFPEVFLDQPGGSERIDKIHQHMRDYLQQNILSTHDGLILLERSIDGHTRRGVMAALDLECYDFTPASRSLIRATEGTILERIPPRVKIREGAPLELPHIMVLIDDPEDKVISSLYTNRSKMQKIYDFDLMLGSGHLTGWFNQDPQLESQFIQALENLADPEKYQSKYGIDLNKGMLLYAMGDGNHSLATAKSIWEKIKSRAGPEHPARYALVEIENVHDSGLIFEPIHRAVFGVKSNLQIGLDKFFGEGYLIERVENWDQMQSRVKKQNRSTQDIGIISSEGYSILTIKRPQSNLAVGSLQPFIDQWLIESRADKIDYIHGDEIVRQISSQSANIVFYLPKMEKTDLFKTVLMDGALPRKTFSIGEAKEKRFYLECRRIG